MLKAIHAQERRSADRKGRAIVDDLRTARMSTAVDLVEGSSRGVPRLVDPGAL